MAGLTPQEAVDAFTRKQQAHDAVHNPQLSTETDWEHRQRVLGGAINALTIRQEELAETLKTNLG